MPGCFFRGRAAQDSCNQGTHSLYAGAAATRSAAGVPSPPANEAIEYVLRSSTRWTRRVGLVAMVALAAGTAADLTGTRIWINHLDLHHLI